MDTSTYDETIFAMRDVIYKDYPFAIVRQRLLQLCIGQQNIAFIDTICSELGSVCVQPLSKIVNRATMIIAELATNGGPEITLRMCQKDFQDYLMYTLRRLTTKLGNLLTMHPEIWAEIEARVLNLYDFWFKRLGNQDGKYFHALQRYRMLRQTVAFPSYNPYLQNENNNPVEVKPVVSKLMLGDVKELIDWCNNKIQEGSLNDVMNTACVRNIKSRSQHLHRIWTTQQLVGQDKTNVKNYYSELRKLSKFIDAENDKKKKQEQKNYLQGKKNKIQTGVSIQPAKIMSPIKANLLDSTPSDLLFNQEGSSLMEPIKVAYTPLVETSLIDTSEVSSPQRPKKKIDLEKQLMEVFSSPSDKGSSQLFQTPKKEEEEFDEFNMFSAAISSSQQIPAVAMINEEEIDSPMKPKNRVQKQEELIDLI